MWIPESIWVFLAQLSKSLEAVKKKKIKKNLPNQSETSFLLKKIWIKGAVENNEELEA